MHPKDFAPAQQRGGCGCIDPYEMHFANLSLQGSEFAWLSAVSKHEPVPYKRHQELWVCPIQPGCAGTGEGAKQVTSPCFLVSSAPWLLCYVVDHMLWVTCVELPALLVTFLTILWGLAANEPYHRLLIPSPLLPYQRSTSSPSICIPRLLLWFPACSWAWECVSMCW